MHRTLIATALAALFAAPVSAQSIHGVFVGTIRDSSDAVIPGALVTITNAATGATVFAGKTDGQGAYTARALPAGVYHLTFEADGFKRTELRDVSLKVDERVQANAVLEPGMPTQQITVSGETVGQLKTETSSIAEIVNVAQMKTLPLPGGGRGDDVLNVLMLVGGVSAGGNGTRVNAQQISINGSRTLNTEITVDGVSILSGTTGSITMMPSREAMREVKVLTSAYSAEYGRTSGGFVNAVVDSGGARYRGGVYEYLRNEAFNANNFFNNARNVERPRDRFNQFGGKIGGPIRIPKVYDGRDKSFFFFNYEGLRIANPGAPVSTIPDERFRAGDFSASRVVLRDPASGSPFPNNRIPDSRIDPAARKIMTYLPLPNSAGTPDTANGRTLNNYVYPQSVSEFINNYTGRLDHNARQGSTRVFLRMTYYDQSRPVAAIMPGPLNNERGPEIQVGWQAAAGLIQTLSPTLLLELNGGFHKNDQVVDPPVPGLNATEAFGIQRTVGDSTPTFNISGWRTLGLNGNTLRRQITNTFQYSGSLSWSKQAHLIKMGAQFRRNHFNVLNPGGEWTGSYNFNGEITNVTSSANNPVNAMGDYLLGALATASYKLPQPLTGRRNYNLGLFIQDDWKITRRLTLNLGLRHEYESPMVIVNDIYSRIDDATGKMLVAGKNASRSLNIDASRFNLAPRAGFAFAWNDKTVIRAGAGLFYGQIFSNLGTGGHPGYTVTQAFPDRGVGVPQLFTLSQGVPLIAVQDLNDPFAAERASSPESPLSAGTQFSQINPLSSVWQWNFGIQRRLPYMVLLDTSYVSSRGLHLPLNPPYNIPPYELAEALALAGRGAVTQRARPFPNLAAYNPRIHAGNSSYHSLQVRGTREFANSLSFLTTYTWSKAMDDGSGFQAGPGGGDPGQFPTLYRYLDRAPGGFDRTHNLTVAALYETRWKWIRGWQISPTMVARTGIPDTIAQSTLNVAASQQRPHVLSSTSLYVPGRQASGTAIRYLMDPRDSAFPLAPSGPLAARIGGQNVLLLPSSIGTLGRNTIRMPGEFNIDLAVSRRFRIRESLNLQLRAEAFNLLNKTNLQSPNMDLAVTADASGRAIFNAPNFGLITGARPARFMQLVLRLEF